MAGKYEFALTYDLQLPSELAFTPLVEFPPYVMLAAQHQLAKRQHIDIQDLAPEPMVLLDWPLSRDYFYSLFLSAGLEPNFAYKAKSLAMVRGLVANGFGYSLFNTPLASNATMDGNEIVQVPLVSKQGKHRPMSLGVVSVKGLRLSPVSKAFIEVVKQQLVN